MHMQALSGPALKYLDYPVSSLLHVGGVKQPGINFSGEEASD